MPENSRTASRSRVTLRDIAAHAGVSRSTVSLVMQGSELVAASTRARVREAITELGYVYNRGAATLRSARTATLGVVVHDITNPFFGAMVAGIDETLQAAGYVPFLANTGDSLARQQRFLDRMHEQRVDALLLCPAADTPMSLIETLAGWGIPCVEVMRHAGDVPFGDYVGTDIRRGMIEAVSHLAAMGHERITLLAGMTEHSADRERLAGYRQGMIDAGLESRIDVSRGAIDRRGGLERAQALLRRPQPPTALICHNDLVALGALLALARLGIRSGSECAVVGTDDIEEAALVAPPLTSIATHPYVIGQTAAALALRRIAQPHDPPERIVLEAPLQIRESSMHSVTPLFQEST